MERTVLVAFACLLLSAAAAAQTPVVHHVDPLLGDDAAPGTAAEPLRTVGEGLARTAAGDTVRLADGVYLGAGNRELVLPVHPVVVISASGVREDCVIDCEGAGRAFTADAGQDTTTVIAALTIRNGWSGDRGGAIRVGPDSNLLIRDCLFLGNRAASGGAVACGAIGPATGAPYPGLGAGPVIRDCRFEGNEATGSGGAIWGNQGSRPWIAGAEFVANTCGSMGGAVSLTFVCGGFIQDSDFLGNTAGYSGGGLDVSFEQETLTVDCRFEGNRAPRGGAVANTIGWSKKSGDKAPPGGPDFARCVFVGNEAEEGGAVYFWNQCWMEFDDCRFVGNTATVAGGACVEYWENNNVFRRCLFVDNAAPAGGAFHREDGSTFYGYATSLLSCTLVGNTAASGAALSCRHYEDHDEEWAGYLIENTIISHHTDGPTFVFTDTSPPRFSCSDLYANAGGDWTGAIAPQVDERGNFSADPCYCDPGAGDYRLSGDSWCLPGNHPWGCDGLVGAYGAGCDPSGCNGPVATLVAGFRAEAAAGRVVLSWRVGGADAPQRFRLEAAAGAARWPVPLRTDGRGVFTAVDEAPALRGARRATYTLRRQDAAGGWREAWVETVDLLAASGGTRLTGVHPNPFNPQTTVAFDLAAPGRVDLIVHDVAGRRVRTLVADQALARGAHRVVWDGRDDNGRQAATGVYFVRLVTDRVTDARRVMLIK